MRTASPLPDTVEDGCLTPPADVVPWPLACVRRLGLEIGIAGYDSGRVSILAL